MGISGIFRTFLDYPELMKCGRKCQCDKWVFIKKNYEKCGPFRCHMLSSQTSGIFIFISIFLSQGNFWIQKHDTDTKTRYGYQNVSKGGVCRGVRSNRNHWWGWATKECIQVPEARESVWKTSQSFFSAESHRNIRNGFGNFREYPANIRSKSTQQSLCDSPASVQWPEAAI